MVELKEFPAEIDNFYLELYGSAVRMGTPKGF